jgi:hypothetical protein
VLLMLGPAAHLQQQQQEEQEEQQQQGQQQLQPVQVLTHMT